MVSRTGLDALGIRKHPIIFPAANWTPVVQPIADLVFVLTECMMLSYSAKQYQTRELTRGYWSLIAWSFTAVVNVSSASSAAYKELRM
jgi:hypothetical protein